MDRLLTVYVQERNDIAELYLATVMTKDKMDCVTLNGPVTQ